MQKTVDASEREPQPLVAKEQPAERVLRPVIPQHDVEPERVEHGPRVRSAPQAAAERGKACRQIARPRMDRRMDERRTRAALFAFPGSIHRSIHPCALSMGLWVVVSLTPRVSHTVRL